MSNVYVYLLVVSSCTVCIQVAIAIWVVYHITDGDVEWHINRRDVVGSSGSTQESVAS